MINARSAPDLLLLEGMEFFGAHGHLDAERALGVHLGVDVALRTDTSGAGRSDALADTIDYADCYERIRQIVETESHHLLETVAERIATELLRSAPAVRVTVSKRPPLPGAFARFAVTIERTREDAEPVRTAAARTSEDAR